MAAHPRRRRSFSPASSSTLRRLRRPLGGTWMALAPVSTVSASTSGWPTSRWPPARSRYGWAGRRSAASVIARERSGRRR